MLLGIDGRAANATTRVGVNIYCQEIIRALAAMPERISLRVYLDQPPAPSFPDISGTADIRVLPRKPRWTLTQLARELRREPPDVFLITSLQYPIGVPCPKVAAVHETAFLYLPQYWGFLQRMRTIGLLRLTCRRADRLIAISNVVKQDLVKYLRVPPARISVAHYGIADSLRPVRDTAVIERVRQRLKLPERYFVFVGRLSPRKNVGRIIQAFETVCRRNPSLPHVFVIAGDKGWLTTELFQGVEHSSIRDRLVFSGYVPYEDVPVLISQADVLVMPALWEAFGMPVLEGMACGVPVLTSNRSGLAEVAGDAAVCVNPEDTAAIAHALEQLLLDESLRDTLREKGLAHAANFTWRKTAEKTIAICRQALTNEPAEQEESNNQGTPAQPEA